MLGSEGGVNASRRRRGRPPARSMQDKTALRAMLADRRAAAFAAEPDAGTRLARHWPLGSPRDLTIAGYVQFRSEINPAPFLGWLSAQGARLCLPVTPQRPGQGLTFRAYVLGDALVKSRFGVLEPSRDAAEVCPDVVLVPLLGFDRNRNRLGYGQGHYDRTLKALRAAGPVIALGLAFDAQHIDDLPRQDHDERLDGILTPTQAIMA